MSNFQQNFQVNAQKMCKNKLALFCMFLFITFIVSTIIYYSKLFKNEHSNENSNENSLKETPNEIALRCVVPGAVISICVVLVLYFAEFPVKKEPLLKFGFYDDNYE